MPPHLLQPDSLAASHQSNKQDQGHHLEALPVAVHIRSLVRQAEKARCTHHTSRDPDDVVTDDSGPSQDSIRLRIRLASLTSIKPAAWGPWRSRLPGVPSSKNSGRHDALAGWPILHFSLAAGLPCRPTFCSRHSPTPTFLGHALASFSPLADRTAQRSRETLKKRT